MKLPIPLPEAASASVDFVALGESSVDYVGVVSGWPKPDEKMPLAAFSVEAGGQAATAALACRRLGWRSRYAGCVGDDVGATVALRGLTLGGVDLRVVTRSGARTRTALVVVDRESGARTVLGYRDEGLKLRPGELGVDDVGTGRLLLVDATDIPAAVAAAKLARRRAIPVVLDVDAREDGIDELLAEVDVLIAGEAAVRSLSGVQNLGDALRTLAGESGARVVVATLGRRGSLAWCAGREVWSAAKQVSVLDTTGAGDAFRGGFAAGWLRDGPGAELESVLAYANAVAALNCRALGAQAGLPSSVEVDRFL